MRTCCVKNGLVVAVVLLFIGVAVQPVIIAVDNDTDDDESIDNSEIGERDNYREILSSLECGCASVTFRGLLGWNSIDGYYISLFRLAEIYAAGDNYRIRITGYKFPTLNNPNIDFSVEARSVIAPFFIGYCAVSSPGCESVEGIALGNIKWS